MMRREGMVLAAVMVITALAAMIATSLLFRITAEVSAGAAKSRGLQARAASMSGLQQAMAVLASAADNPDLWRDNPDLFKNQLVCDDGTNRWYFTIYARNSSDPDNVRYGLTDESGKINLAGASTGTLRKLIELVRGEDNDEAGTEELLDCLMDYMDFDDELLQMQYELKEAPGGGRGRGGNRNSDREAGDVIESGVDKDDLETVMGRLTVWSDSTRGATPEPGGDREPSDDEATPPETNDEPSRGDENETPRGGTFVGPVSFSQTVNVYAAPREVLMVLPGMDAGAADNIIAERDNVPAEDRENLAWLYVRDAVDADTFKAIAPLLTTRGYQFHVRCVGFGSPSGRFCVLEAVLDVTGDTPRIVYLRDLTRLGVPFALDPEDEEM